jgi:superfamily II DNA/RNA helicase
MERDEKCTFVADSLIYMHRTGRAGRFGWKGVVLTLFEKDEEERCYMEILNKLNL